VVLLTGCLTGCRTVPFRGDGRDHGGAVLSLGGATPYLRPSTARRTAAPPPAAPAAPAGDSALNIYAATREDPSPAVRHLPPRVYVADGKTITVLDPTTYKPTARITAVKQPRRVIPSWDLKTLWAMSPGTLTPLDPATGHAGRPTAVPGLSALLFTPDGRHALVLAAKRAELRTPHTLKPQATIPLPCKPTGHADFAADGSYLLASCENRLVRIDPAARKVTGILDLGPAAAPQEVRLSSDGMVFYVADPSAAGVWLVDAATLRETGFVATGTGASGLLPSRTGDSLYVADGKAATLSQISFTTHQLTAQWPLPPGAALGGVSADGGVLWLAGYGALYAMDTTNGHILRRLSTPAPHGLCLYPQPGRHSLGELLR